MKRRELHGNSGSEAESRKRSSKTILELLLFMSKLPMRTAMDGPSFEVAVEMTGGPNAVPLTETKICTKPAAASSRTWKPKR